MINSHSFLMGGYRLKNLCGYLVPFRSLRSGDPVKYVSEYPRFLSDKANCMIFPLKSESLTVFPERVVAFRAAQKLS
jgi:hypothetical protein